MTQEMITVEQERYMPALTMPQAIQRRNAMIEFVKEIMVESVDYGVIPGTSNKPTLYKPGAERLCSFFGLTPDFEAIKETEQWSDDEPLFYYRYKCRLLRDGRVIGDGEGSCNSRESKYRWRESKRVCPACNQAAIIKGKEEYGGGWVCFKKQGGCGAKYSDGAQEIEGQPAGRVPNPDIFDIVNTIQKMAQKRAFIAATLIAVNASEYFTQDVEDMQPSTPSADPHLLEVLKADLGAVRDRLRTIGGEPRKLSQAQVAAMTAQLLADELAQTNATLWDLTVVKLSDARPKSKQSNADWQKEYDDIDKATAAKDDLL